MQRVLIVGCGNIAGGFDAERAVHLPPLTHAGAFSRHGGFQLTACVEPDAERRQSFMRRWGVQQGHADLAALQLLHSGPGRADLQNHPDLPSFPDLSASSDSSDPSGAGPFDVISLCSPTAAHAPQIEAALALRPRLIFCEKPVTPTLAQTQALVQRCAAAGVPLAVNHTRRWAPDVQRLATELQAGVWGPVRSVVGTYNKGVLNNGSHMVDLLHQLLGTLTLQHAGRAQADHWSDDPSVPAVLQSASGVEVHLNTAHAADGAIFELQIFTATAVIAMEDGGQQWRVRRVIDSPHFKNYRVLDSGERKPGTYLQATARAVDNLYQHLTQGQALASTGDTALAAQRLCDEIRRRAD